MRRRASGRPVSSHFAPATPQHPANHCHALVLVDGAAVRKKIKKDYEKALRDLERSRLQLEQFQKTDLPEFTRWLNSQFGSLLTELRELSQKITQDETLIYQVESEVMFGGGSHARAYQRVMDFRENPPPPPPHSSNQHQAHPESDPEAPRGSEEEDFDAEADPLDELFEEIFGGFGKGGQAGGDSNPRSRPGSQSTPPPVPARLKDLYRKLVRHLHPDAQEEMTPQKKEWWHQAQAAYRAGDADQLEVILTLCEIGDTGTTANTSATLLHRITAQLKSSLREIKRQIAGRRKDLAWNFSKRPNREVLAAELHGSMSRDLEAMRERWRETQELIAGWKAGAERLKKPRKHQKQSPTANSR